MKFLCVPCDEPMKLEKSEGPEDGSMSVIFGCTKCKNKIAMLTNEQETQFVKSLDVCLGGRKSDPEPLGAVTHGLAKKKDDDEIVWTSEAEERLEKVPVFVRQMAKMGVINFAKENEIREITPEVMDQAREKMGM